MEEKCAPHVKNSTPITRFPGVNVFTNQTGLLAKRAKEYALNFLAQDFKVDDFVRVTNPYKENRVTFPQNFKLDNGRSGKGSRVVCLNAMDLTPVTH